MWMIEKGYQRKKQGRKKEQTWDGSVRCDAMVVQAESPPATNAQQSRQGQPIVCAAQFASPALPAAAVIVRWVSEITKKDGSSGSGYRY